MPFAEDIDRMRAVAALQPHPARMRYLRGDVTYCPLCGFTLADDWDGHFLPCLVRHAGVAWYSNPDAGVSREAVVVTQPGPQRPPGP